MSNHYNKLMDEIKNMVFCNLLQNCNSCLYVQNINQFNMLINCLIKANIKFLLDFHQGTSKYAQSVGIFIELNPTTKIYKIIQFQEGPINAYTIQHAISYVQIT